VSEGRWRFSVTVPDWGENHLALDAIVAFVDEELEPGPQERAARHVARCLECAAQVVAQTQARVALRTAAGPRLPSSLLSALRSIPEHTDLPAPPSGLAMSADGEIVQQVRPEPAHRHVRRARLADAPPAGLPHANAIGVEVRPAPDTVAAPNRPGGHTAVAAEPPAADHGRRPPTRRIRLGTGVAVSGLALGALAFGVAAAAPSEPIASLERGVLGGPVLGGTSPGGSVLNPSGLVEARLRLGGPQLGAPEPVGTAPVGTAPVVTEPVVDGLRELGGLPGAASVRGLW
jgi:hypothetical protein